MQSTKKISNNKTILFVLISILMVIAFMLISSASSSAVRFPAYGKEGTIDPYPPLWTPGCRGPGCGFWHSVDDEKILQALITVNQIDDDLINRENSFIKVGWLGDTKPINATIKLYNGGVKCTDLDSDNTNECRGAKTKFEVYRRNDLTTVCQTITLSGEDSWTNLIDISNCIIPSMDDIGLYSAIIKASVDNIPTTDRNKIKLRHPFRVEALPIGVTHQAYAGFASIKDGGSTPLALSNRIAEILPGGEETWANDNEVQTNYSIKMRVGCETPANSPLKLSWEDADRQDSSTNNDNDADLEFRVIIKHTDGRPNDYFNSVDVAPGNVVRHANFIGGSQTERNIIFDGSKDQNIGAIYPGSGLGYFYYNPPNILVSPGDTIEWYWDYVRYSNNLTVSLHYDAIDTGVQLECSVKAKTNINGNRERDEYAEFYDRGFTAPGYIPDGAYFNYTIKHYLRSYTTSQVEKTIESASNRSLSDILSFNNDPSKNSYKYDWGEWGGTLGRNVGDYICEEISITMYVPSNASLNESDTARDCFYVVNRPVVKFFGADVATGACNSTGGIYTWARQETYAPPPDDTYSGNYKGASAQYAVYALGSVDGPGDGRHGFYSRSNSAGDVATQLTFANTTGGLGGGFASTIGCYDPVSSMTASDGIVTTNTYDPPSSIATREHITAYIRGDVTVNHDVKYSGTGSWGSRAEIPSYRLYVDGDIYIGSGVDELDGYYYATGNIITCANSSGDYLGFANCNRQLNVYGAFEAKGSIKYWRNNGTLIESQNLSNVAEIFTLSPELYFGYWDSGLNGYSFINNLAPVF
jgi:hypothetical protein